LTAHVRLFGSIANFIGYRKVGREQAGWTSSAWADIQELIDTRGAVNNSQWEDKGRAFEAAEMGAYLGRGSSASFWRIGTG
jgi:hypothetical protein